MIRPSKPGVPVQAFAAWLNSRGIPPLTPQEARPLVWMHDAYLADRDKMPPALRDLADGYDGALRILFATWQRQAEAGTGKGEDTPEVPA